MEPHGADEEVSKVDPNQDAVEEDLGEIEAPHELITDEAINFPEDVKEMLLSRGFVIYDLEGKTVEELSRELGATWVNMHESRSLHEKSKSFKGQIAFKPGEDGAESLGAEFLKPGQAQELVMDYDEAVREKIPGARAVMASMGTTLALIAKHREMTAGQEKYLFREPIYGNSVMIRTSTVDNKWNKMAVEVGNNEGSVGVRSIPAQPEHFTKLQRTYAFIVPQAAVAA